MWFVQRKLWSKHFITSSWFLFSCQYLATCNIVQPVNFYYISVRDNKIAFYTYIAKICSFQTFGKSFFFSWQFVQFLYHKKERKSRTKNSHTYLSCPAVSQICALMRFRLMVTVLVWNSTPIVGLESKKNSSLENLPSSWLLPTAESPTTTTLNT